MYLSVQTRLPPNVDEEQRSLSSYNNGVILGLGIEDLCAALREGLEPL